MITSSIANFFFGIISNIISIFNLPGIPTDTLNNAKDYVSLLLSNLSLLGLGVRPTSLKAVCGILITLTVFKFAFPKIKFLLSKLPFFKN